MTGACRWFSATGLLLVSTAATAAPPKKTPKGRAEGAAAPAPAPPAEAPPAAPATEAAKPVDDLGERPTPAVDAKGSKLSPLTPAPNEFPGKPLPTPTVELDRLLGDIATLRGRVAALTTTLFKSRIRIIVEAHGSEARIEALNVNLDDGVVFAAPERFSAEDEKIVYEHAVAPGQHVLGLDIEGYDLRGKNFRTWQSSRFSVVVPEGQLVEAPFKPEDDPEMAEDSPDDQAGEYEIGARLRARVAE